MDKADENISHDLNTSTYLSILQRSYIAIMPIIKEIYKRLVKEEGAVDELESKAETYVDTEQESIKFDRTYK